MDWKNWIPKSETGDDIGPTRDGGKLNVFFNIFVYKIVVLLN